MGVPRPGKASASLEDRHISLGPCGLQVIIRAISHSVVNNIVDSGRRSLHVSAPRSTYIRRPRPQSRLL